MRNKDYKIIMKPGQIVLPTIEYCKRNRYGSSYGFLFRVTETYKSAQLYDEETGESYITRSYLCICLNIPEAGGGGFWIHHDDIYQDFSLDLDMVSNPVSTNWYKEFYKDLLNYLPLDTLPEVFFNLHWSYIYLIGEKNGKKTSKHSKD